MTSYPNIYGVIPSPATVMVLMGRGMVLEICTHGIPMVNPNWKKRDQQHRTHIKISWVSGHNGVASNEQVDAEVKKAVEFKPRHNAAGQDIGG